MKFLTSIVVTILISSSVMAKKNVTYYTIPDPPKEFTAATVVSRMVDGLGFRYYWATYGLKDADLSFKPTTDSKTSFETLKHIYDLTTVILNSVIKETNTGKSVPEMTFVEMRNVTLLNIEKSSKILKNSTDISEYKLIFKSGENTTEYPFWNQINGPISDALWHVGQVVTFRRSSGNPLPKGVSVLSGTKKD
jgi:hypothetical protein